MFRNEKHSEPNLNKDFIYLKSIYIYSLYYIYSKYLYLYDHININKVPGCRLHTCFTVLIFTQTTSSSELSLSSFTKSSLLMIWPPDLSLQPFSFQFFTQLVTPAGNTQQNLQAQVFKVQTALVYLKHHLTGAAGCRPTFETIHVKMMSLWNQRKTPGWNKQDVVKPNNVDLTHSGVSPLIVNLLSV